jgi:hypothetical protein
LPSIEGRLQALQNSAASDWPAGSYKISITNPNLLGISKSWGWDYSSISNGTAVGMLKLVRL